MTRRHHHPQRRDDGGPLFPTNTGGIAPTDEASIEASNSERAAMTPYTMRRRYTTQKLPYVNQQAQARGGKVAAAEAEEEEARRATRKRRRVQDMRIRPAALSKEPLRTANWRHPA
jgi:hypothetical protein